MDFILYASLCIMILFLQMSLMVQMVLGEVKDTRPGIGIRNVGPQARIVGGYDTATGRYPYIVTMFTETGFSPCGGTLVAPDLVLTAAHCTGVLRTARVGAWNRDDASDEYEDFTILSPEYLHPEYVELSFPFDMMILKLDRPSTKGYIQLNSNPNLPSGERIDELTALGFGYTRPGDSNSESSILQEVGLTYVPTSICEQAKDPSISGGYSGQISDDMLCAQQNGQDACQGDSGGPLIIANDNAANDVLVGVISWGYGCALPSFPGVYSRVSHQFEWIKNTICEASSNPPAEYECGSQTVPITIVIQFDDFPRETGWSIRSKESGEVLVDVPQGSYAEPRAQAQETVFLPAGSSVVWKIEDKFGDGLCCNTPGNFLVVAGQNQNGEVLATGGGNFGYREEHEIFVPESYSSVSADGTDNVAGEGEIYLTIVIRLDGTPQEIGWKVDRLDIEVEPVIRVPAGVYINPRATVTRTIILKEGELYFFELFDVMGNGLDGGYVQIYLGTKDTNDKSRLVYESDGVFSQSIDFQFRASFDDESTEAPGFDETDFLTLELRTDIYPEEIGLQLRANTGETAVGRQSDQDDTVLFFRPPRYYASKTNEVVIETIPIPRSSSGASRSYTFIVTDSFGDGLCCRWSGDEDTGYTLYKGVINPNNVLISSSFEETDKEVTPFIITGPLNEGGDGQITDSVSQATLPKVKIKVTVTLDQFPDETGFYIQDAEGSKVVNVPPGTYVEQFQVVEETYSLDVGAYNITIVDVQGDGLVRDGSYYAVHIVDEKDRPALLTGDVFAWEETKFFVLEGNGAEYPLQISFRTDEKPEEFGFSVYRLDVLEQNALVASVPPGSYQQKKQDVVESLQVKEGSLYRILFEDTGQDGINGDIRIVMGSEKSNDLKAATYVVSEGSWQEWQVKIVAGKLPLPPSEAQTIDMRMTFDRFPHEVEWILLADQTVSDTTSAPTSSLDRKRVVAYGPINSYSEDLANTEHTETIRIPPFSGKRDFSLLVTDYAGDGVCCNFGDGGPVEVFDGPVSDGKLLFSHPFEETGRVLESFVLVGKGSSSSVVSLKVTTLLLLGGLTLWSSFLLS